MLKDLSKQELLSLQKELKEKYSKYKNMNLSLDMSRGKPGVEQLGVSEGLLKCIQTNEDCFSEDGIDCRNYSHLEGIPEARKLFADIMGLSPDEVIAAGNSSLNIMYDTVARGMLFGVLGSEKPWGKYDKIKFLCPVPGYDRHFTVCETFGIEMINVPMTAEGPDMDIIANLVESDETIKGMWCIPKYSNPEGITYSDETVKKLAQLNPKAKDFRIFWDNAYVVHTFSDKEDHLLNLMDELKKTGKEDMVFMFASTSKITFPGSGVAAIGASVNNIKHISKDFFPQTICSNKLNQLRHVRYFKDAKGIKEHMKKHAAFLKPRFEVVLKTLSEQFGDGELAEWANPNGGYFVSCNVMNGCAKRTIALLKEAGVTMTPAGATFPYGKDPCDSNIRIAPTFPPVDELQTAMDMFCLCVKLAAVEKLLVE